MTFELHPRLASDTYYLGDFPLCALLLSKDANYPWYILVPKQPNITEAFQLNTLDQHQLQYESRHLSQSLSSSFNADKMNIAALGNIVPQLHLHHIVRYKTDPTWPQPIWGNAEAQPYNDIALRERIKKTALLLANSDFKACINSYE